MRLYMLIICSICCSPGSALASLTICGSLSLNLISFGWAKLLSGCIAMIANSVRVVRLSRGSELILPPTTMNSAGLPQLWLRIIVLNSPFTGSECCKVFNLALDGWKVGWWAVRWMSALNLCYPLRSHLPNVSFYINIYFVQPYTHCLGRASIFFDFLGLEYVFDFLYEAFIIRTC